MKWKALRSGKFNFKFDNILNKICEILEQILKRPKFFKIALWTTM